MVDNTAIGVCWQFVQNVLYKGRVPVVGIYVNTSPAKLAAICKQISDTRGSRVLTRCSAY